MGNLFLGFPVARSKIADMIRGSASPIEHHARHESGGDDEIDISGLNPKAHHSTHESGGSDVVAHAAHSPQGHKASHENGGADEINLAGLEGAGGGVPFADFLLNQIPESLDGYDTNLVNGGTVTLGPGYVQLLTTGTAGSSAAIWKNPNWINPPLTWDNNFRFLCALSWKTFSSNLGLLYLGIGKPEMNDRCIGFLFEDGDLFGVASKPGTLTKVLMGSWFSGAYQTQGKLEFRHTGLSRVDFYMDGNLIDSIVGSQYLPNDITYANYVMGAYVDNLSENNQLQLRIGMFKVHQAA